MDRSLAIRLARYKERSNKRLLLYMSEGGVGTKGKPVFSYAGEEERER